MSITHIRTTGEYLGYCNLKGYLYSIRDLHNELKYHIYALKNNECTQLITFIKGA
jgi:hypothetical protein